MRGHKRMGEGAMAQLGDHEFFLTLDPESNSVAIHSVSRPQIKPSIV
jgi:hypothetical protein